MPNPRARDLRHNMTDAERLLWYFLRARRLGGYKFRRQHPIGPFIADFVASSTSWSSKRMAGSTPNQRPTRGGPTGLRRQAGA
jgi:hypothetical protein